MYNFETSTLKLSWRDYSDAYRLASCPITITGEEADDNAKQLDGRNKRVTFENCAPFTDWVRKINNTQVDPVKYPDVLTWMYNLIECSCLNYLKTPGGLWQHYRSDQNDIIKNSELFKSKLKLTRNILGTDNTKNVKRAVPLNV